MSPKDVALRLTASGLLKGKTYNYLDVDLYRDNRGFVISYDNKDKIFNQPIMAVFEFMKMVNRRREQVGNASH